MKRLFLLPVFLLLSAMPYAGQPQNDYPIAPVTFERVQFTDAFFGPRIETNRTVTIPYAFKKSEETGRIDNFRIAGKIKEGTSFCSSFPFDDSDVYKIIEGAAYSLSVHPDPKLESYLDDLIGIIAKAQEQDGYLYTARTIKSQKPVIWVNGPRWSNLREGHELYNLGHMYEAAVAHYLATGKRSFLNVAIKSADLISSTFGPDKNYGVPGHEEVEIGLVKLSRATGNKKYLDLAKFFVDQRGNADNHKLYGLYAQDHKPIKEQTEAVGHAVRAGYFYSGIADVAAMTGTEQYKDVIDTLWNNVVSKKLYITGGIGAKSEGEAFGNNYELPNFSAYCETCAAIANVLWNYRMFLLSGDAKYFDVLERTLYNGVISGISFSGDKFFYPNPLSVGKSGNERSPWFDCSCCPSNLSRFLPSIPGYIFAQKDNTVFVNLFMGCKTTLPVGDVNVNFEQMTGYPWKGNIKLLVSAIRDKDFTLSIRIPGWAQNKPVPSDLYRYDKDMHKQPIIKVNGRRVQYKMQNGYAVIHRVWQQDDSVELILPMAVRRVLANENVKDDQGRVALEYGPLVYCVEWPEYADSVFNLLLPDTEPLKAVFDKELFGGVNVINGKAYSCQYSNDKKSIYKKRLPFKAIPYYAWAHRGKGEMSIWLANKIEAVQPTKPPTIASQSKVTYSFMRQKAESLLSEAALNDQTEPKNSDDQTIPRFNWWPNVDKAEWVQYDFAKKETVSTVNVYWFDDSSHGGCKVPASWKLLYKDGGEWKPVKNTDAYGCAKDQFNTVHFDAIETTGLRIEAQLQPKSSAGILEWQVN